MTSCFAWYHCNAHCISSRYEVRWSYVWWLLLSDYQTSYWCIHSIKFIDEPYDWFVNSWANSSVMWTGVRSFRSSSNVVSCGNAVFTGLNRHDSVVNSFDYVQISLWLIVIYWATNSLCFDRYCFDHYRSSDKVIELMQLIRYINAWVVFSWCTIVMNDMSLFHFMHWFFVLNAKLMI